MDVLNSYLVQHRSINIPGLGTLYIEAVPARSDFVNKQLLPPFLSYRFDKYFDAPDKDFFEYLATQKQIPEHEAIRWYNEFALSLRTELRSKEEAGWEGIGVFKKDATGEIIFEENKSGSIYEPVTAERVIRSNASHAMRVGDKETTTVKMNEILHEDIYEERESWWIYALIIATLAICIISYHFYRHGLEVGSYFK